MSDSSTRVNSGGLTPTRSVSEGKQSGNVLADAFGWRAERAACGCPGRMPAAANRREFLQNASMGFGWLAFSGMLGAHGQNDTGTAARPSLADKQIIAPHIPARAKHVIFLFMDGGVSHVDSFDPKTELERRHGEKIGNRRPTPKSQSVSPDRTWKKSPWAFQSHGQSGLPVSELFPHIARRADDLCVVRSMVGETPLHGQQTLLLHTGRVTGGAPSFGSWVSYGLGNENANLPGYVLLNNDWVPNGGLQSFSSSFLPATHQATMVRAKGPPIDNVQSADAATIQRAKLDFLRDQDYAFATGGDNAQAIESAIQNYEVAWRMQTLVPELADVNNETEATLRNYGVDRPDSYQHFYSLQCLRARRLIEAGVRFIEITCPLTHFNNAPWDQHAELKKHHEENALITDQPIGALLTDLKARGLLDDTIVLWAGEMGRTPHVATPDGRDHHVAGYTIWLCGGGFRGGTVFGATDELGMEAVDQPVTIHDIHATILYLLGLDHERLGFRFGGRDVRLTDVHGHVLTQLIA
jgi:Protein of unknown function (DUF1501)